MHIHRLTADEALSSLKTSAAGLLQTEAARRLAEFGPNHVAGFFAALMWALEEARKVWLRRTARRRINH